VTVHRLLFGGLTATVLILGYYGLGQYLPEHPAYARGVFDIAYDDIQLFVLGSDPLQDGGSVPLALQLARFGAPMVTLLAVVETIRVLLANEVNRIRTRRSRGHAIVCGDSTTARTIAARLHTDGQRVVLVRSRPISQLELRGRELFGVTGDATSPEVLRGAGIAHAAVVFVATDDSSMNVAIAQAAARLMRKHSSSAAIYVQIHDPELCVSLRARRLGLAQTTGPKLDFFNVDELAARVLFDQDPLPVRAGQPPRLLIAGGSEFARAVLVESIRRWRLQDSPDKLMVTYVADNARATLTMLNNRYPFMSEACDPTGYEVPLPVLLAAPILAESYDRAFISYRDEQETLKIALSTHGLWYGRFRKVVVSLDRLAGLSSAFDGRSGSQLLDEVRGSLWLYPYVEAGSDPALISEDLVERLARLIHDRYLLSRRQQGDADAALVDWDNLDAERHRANRSQAAHIGVKLRSIDCVVIPRSAVRNSFTFTDDEVEQLAESEHQRWLKEHQRPGLRYAGSGDSPRYRANWAELPDDARQINRDAVLSLPAILADAGFDIVRESQVNVHLVG
jgi:hypothetical protein